MNRFAYGLAAVTAGLVIAPSFASALSAVTAESTNLRAGPAFDFPVVDRIPSDVNVDIHGCVGGYRWCDVSWRDARGWLPGNQLAYIYQGRRVTVLEYGPRIGLPVVGYSFDSYWDRYYRSRPFYGERARYRTVWRDHERNGTSERVGERRENRSERRQVDRTGRTQERERIGEQRDRRQVDRTDRAREQRQVERRQGTENEPRSERRSNREERSNIRTGRGEQRRGETRGYNPQANPGRGREQGPNASTGRGDRMERGETRGYNPQGNAGPRQEMNRGPRPDANPGQGGGRPEQHGARGGEAR